MERQVCLHILEYVLQSDGASVLGFTHRTISLYPIADWFPGWVHQENYNRQPNDDGLSGQDCVEIRRHFQIAASGGQTVPTVSPLTLSYMWNDRNCDARNYFLCERMMDEGNACCWGEATSSCGFFA